jgi:alpha-mannosidase
VARFVESAGRKVTTAIEWPFRVRGARECDMLERPGRRAAFRRIAFRPFEIRTFRFEVML